VKDEITYTTAGGGTVTWTNIRDGVGRWDCKACGDSGDGSFGTRRFANDHARGCQARD